MPATLTVSSVIAAVQLNCQVSPGLSRSSALMSPALLVPATSSTCSTGEHWSSVTQPAAPVSLRRSVVPVFSAV